MERKQRTILLDTGVYCRSVPCLPHRRVCTIRESNPMAPSELDLPAYWSGNHNPNGPRASRRPMDSDTPRRNAFAIGIVKYIITVGRVRSIDVAS